MRNQLAVPFYVTFEGRRAGPGRRAVHEFLDKKKLSFGRFRYDAAI